MERLDDDSLFDRRMSYAEFDGALEQDLKGKTFQVCTVRQAKLQDVALGNLFWLLQAAKARRRGASVIVTDFYDKPGSSNQGIVELMEILGMKDVDGVTFRRAEDVHRDEALWPDVSAHIREVGVEGVEWAMVGKVRQGVSDTLEGVDEVPASMDRLLEELSVWVDGINFDSVTQLMNHERETMGWVRALRPKAKKRFWQVELPFPNEYRGKYRDVTGPEPEIIQRRLQDLVGKLAIGKTGGQSEDHAEFYEALFRDLVQELASMLRDKADRDKNVTRKIVEAILRIDPRLILFLGDVLRNDDEGNSGFGAIAWAIRDRDKEVIAKIIEGVKMIGDAQLATKSPSMMAVIGNAELLSSVSRPNDDFVVSHEGLNTMLLDERWDIEDLAVYWMRFLEKKGYLREPKFWAHPVAVKLATSGDLPAEKWLEIRAIYEKELFDEHFPPLLSTPLLMPVVVRVLDEVFEEDIERFSEIATNFFMGRGRKAPNLHSGMAGERQLVQYVVERYEASDQGDSCTKELLRKHMDKLLRDVSLKKQGVADPYVWDDDDW